MDIMEANFGIMAHGSRLTAHGSRLTAHGSRLTAHGDIIRFHKLFPEIFCNCNKFCPVQAALMCVACAGFFVLEIKFKI